MPVIRITQRTWERLKKHATPLVHTANDVVEMALVRVAEIPCKPGAGLGKDRLKSAGAHKSQALLTESHSAGISG
jgi:hypothetical protein